MQVIILMQDRIDRDLRSEISLSQLRFSSIVTADADRQRFVTKLVGLNLNV